MHRMWRERTFGAIWLILYLSIAGFAQVSDQELKKEIEAIKQQQLMILKELQELKGLIRGNLAGRPSGPIVQNIEFNLGDNPIRGESTAPLTIVEFTDYQ
jgi:hypothetical protein